MCSRGLLRTIIYNRPCDNSWISRDEKDRSIKIGNGGRAVGGGREGGKPRCPATLETREHNEEEGCPFSLDRDD